MFTAQHQMRSQKGRRSQARVVASVTLIVAILVAGACSSENDATSSTTTVVDGASTTTAAPATTTVAAPATTTVAEDEASEALVFEGTTSPQDEILLFPTGFTNSVALEGDLVGQGAFVGEAFPEGEDLRFEGDWVFHLRSPDLGEGLLTVQQRDGRATPTDFNATGEVIGLSGAFADMVGTVRFTGSDPGTYVFELQPAAPSPEPEEPTEARTIEFETTSVGAWLAEPAYGGGNTTTGDVVGSQGWTGNTTDAASYAVVVGTLDGEKGVFITESVFTSQGATYAAESKLFGVSGAFAGLRGEGTETGTIYASGAFAPAGSFTFKVSG